MGTKINPKVKRKALDYFFNNNDWTNTTYNEFVAKLDDWIDWFNKERPKPALKGLSPVRYRVNHQKHMMFDIEVRGHIEVNCDIIKYEGALAA